MDSSAGSTSLLSTMPLDVLTAISGRLAPDVRLASRSLRYSSVHVLGVGLRGARPHELATKCWMYFPENHSPYYRVTVFSNYSPRNVPDGDGYWSLMAEVCESPKKPVDADRLKETVLTAMRQDGLLPAGTDVVSFWHGRAGHGYPTPFLGRDPVLDQIHPALEARRVFSRGRFGGWKIRSVQPGPQLHAGRRMGRPRRRRPARNHVAGPAPRQLRRVSADVNIKRGRAWPWLRRSPA